MAGKRQSELGWKLMKLSMAILATIVVLIAGLAVLGFVVAAIVFSGHDGYEYDNLAESARSESFSGETYLTPEMPYVELPVSLSIGGRPAENVDLQIGTSLTPFGETAIRSDDLVITQTIERGSGSVRIELREPSKGPAEVKWSVVAVTTATSDQPVPKPLILEIGAPENRAIASPALDLELTPTWKNPTAHRLRFEMETVHEVRIFRQTAGNIRIATEDGVVDVAPGDQLVTLDPPLRCQTQPSCSFEVWMAAFDARSRHRVVVLNSPDDIRVTDIGPVDWQTREQSGATEPVTFVNKAFDEITHSMSIEVDPNDDPLIAAMTLVTVQTEPRVGDVPYDERGREPLVRSWADPPRFWINPCCRNVPLKLDAVALWTEDPVDAWSEWTVTVLSPVEPVRALTVEVDAP